MINIKILLFTFLSSSLLFASNPLTKIKDKVIYGCFNEVTNSNYKSTTLILRNNSLVSDDFIVNEKENKNAVLVVNSYKSKSLETFEVSSLKLEGIDKFKDSADGWQPTLSPNTIFTAKGNLKAFSIQDTKEDITTAKYSDFAAKSMQLVCSTDKKLINSIFLKLILND